MKHRPVADPGELAKVTNSCDSAQPGTRRLEANLGRRTPRVFAARRVDDVGCRGDAGGMTLGARVQRRDRRLYDLLVGGALIHRDCRSTDEIRAGPRGLRHDGVKAPGGRARSRRERSYQGRGRGPRCGRIRRGIEQERGAGRVAQGGSTQDVGRGLPGDTAVNENVRDEILISNRVLVAAGDGCPVQAMSLVTGPHHGFVVPGACRGGLGRLKLPVRVDLDGASGAKIVPADVQAARGADGAALLNQRNRAGHGGPSGVRKSIPVDRYVPDGVVGPTLERHDRRLREHPGPAAVRSGVKPLSPGSRRPGGDGRDGNEWQGGVSSPGRSVERVDADVRPQARCSEGVDVNDVRRRIHEARARGRPARPMIGGSPYMAGRSESRQRDEGGGRVTRGHPERRNGQVRDRRGGPRTSDLAPARGRGTWTGADPYLTCIGADVDRAVVAYP